MHIFDICAIVLTAVFVLIGIKRGFIQELFRLIAVGGGLIGALLLYKTAFAKLGFLHTPHQIKTIVAFIAVYVALLVGLLLAGWLLKKIIHLSMLGWLDRLWGGVFGFVKAVIIVWICVLLIAIGLPDNFRKAMHTSKTYRTFSKIPVHLTIPTSLKAALPPAQRLIPGKAVDSIKKSVTGLIDSIPGIGSGK
jgi:membrane protein required for colicin V production